MSGTADRATRTEVALKWVLRVNGVITLLALPAVFMPLGWMDWLHDRLGMGAAPRGPIFEYLARTVSAMYAIHGGLCFVLAVDVRRYAAVIAYVAAVELALAAVIVWVDLKSGMPPVWIAVEAPMVAAVGGLILFLSRRVGRTSAGGHVRAITSP